METWPTWATEAVQVVDYDPRWVDQGSLERDRLQLLLAPWLIGPIEHVGSTAIPGLAAKPILDLQAPVARLSVADHATAALGPHNWYPVAPELDQRPYRRFFVKVVDGRRAAHLHLLLAAGPRWQEQLAFRDALRADDQLRDAYALLKRQLAAQHRTDRERYTAGKRAFVENVVAPRG